MKVNVYNLRVLAASISNMRSNFIFISELNTMFYSVIIKIQAKEDICSSISLLCTGLKPGTFEMQYIFND